MPDRARDAQRGSNIEIDGQSTRTFRPAPKDPQAALTSNGNNASACRRATRPYTTKGARYIAIDDFSGPRRHPQLPTLAPLTTASPARVFGDQYQTVPLDYTIAVLGAANCGKSSFIRSSFSLDAPPASPIVSKVIYVESTPCLVRIVELSIEQVQLEQGRAIIWPDAIHHTLLPRIDGVVILYDIGDRKSFESIPEILSAIHRADLACILVSGKCDLSPHLRELDPLELETRVRALHPKIATLQTSTKHPEAQKQALLDLISAVCKLELSPKDPTHARHPEPSPAHVSLARRFTPHNDTRASLGYLGHLGMDDEPHARHDSSVGAESGDKTITGGGDDMFRTFLNAEGSRQSHSVSESERTSSVVSEDQLRHNTDADAPGYTFDLLVDRLLLLPKSKADGRFRAIFLALYRKFAAPGQLLDAIIHRFEALETAQVAFMPRTISQLRYLSILEQWIGMYPGDFAYPQTHRRLRAFVGMLASTRIFSAAAKEMSADLDAVVEDDDTNWACCDRDRMREGSLTSNTSLQSGSSTLLDDARSELSDNLSPLTLDIKRSASETSTSVMLPSSYGLLHSVDIARRQAASLVPTPRNPINKSQWHILLDLPNDTIAKELTRIDWIMFSSIRPRDLVRHVSLPAAQKTACTSLIHVNRMINHFNHLRDWVANFILLREKAKHRVSMLEKFMQVARKLRDLNNYNALGAFLAGINSAAVHRLNATRELLTPDIQKDWMKLEILMSPTRSYSAYRLAWENSSGERIPFMPLPLRDLVGAQEGNRTFTGEADERINWHMFEVMGEVIVGIQKAQGQPYRNLSATSRQDELRSLILQTALNKDDEALYDRSVQLEPSNASDRRGIKEFFKRSTTMMG